MMVNFIAITFLFKQKVDKENRPFLPLKKIKIKCIILHGFSL